MAVYELGENNSGGNFWLSRGQYEALFADGWYLEERETDSPLLSEDFGRFDSDNEYTSKGRVPKGEGVPYSWRRSLRVEADSLQDAVQRFEQVTGEDFFAEGCNCCGAPFSMYSVSDGSRDYGDYISGDSVERRTIRPW